MIINVEFFDENPIENVITNLNYKIDKTIFFGYADTIKENKRCTERFLKDICKVKEVEFCTVDNYDLANIIDKISDTIKEDIQAAHKVFFDLTGGESLPLVSFGILSREFSAPMHMYDIQSGQMYEYGYEGTMLLSEVAEYKPITLNLDSFISLYGGIINYRMHKDFKDTWSDEEVKNVIDMWNLSRKYKTKWVYYSALLRKFMPDDNLTVYVEAKKFTSEIKKNTSIGSAETFHQFLDDCESLGFMKNVCHENGVYSYQYRSDSIKNYFWDGGSILEIYAFLKERYENDVDDCRVGVHIDWDGVMHKSAGKDVLNEIDIMSIKNNLPTFISCKIGNVDQMALYELETVANRFGGKYAKKVLVIAKDMAPGHALRAEEMGIEVRFLNEMHNENINEQQLI